MVPDIFRYSDISNTSIGSSDDPSFSPEDPVIGIGTLMELMHLPVKSLYCYGLGRFSDDSDEIWDLAGVMSVPPEYKNPSLEKICLEGVIHANLDHLDIMAQIPVSLQSFSIQSYWEEDSDIKYFVTVFPGVSRGLFSQLHGSHQSISSRLRPDTHLPCQDRLGGLENLASAGKAR